VTSAIAVQPQESIRLRGRSFMAFVLTPSLPIRQWLVQLDKWEQEFTVGRPIILDLAGAAVGFPRLPNCSRIWQRAVSASWLLRAQMRISSTLRCRPFCKSDNTRARIFCNKNEAELISIDGYYRTIEHMDASLRSRPTQCWLEDRVLSIAALD